MINSIDNIVPGDILADVRKVRGPTLEDAITEVRVSSTANDKAVVGVFYAVPNKEYTPIALVGADDSGLIAISMLSLGEGHVNVCGLGGNLEPGDLITSSSIPGKGMKQADDVVRNYTVGKARESVTFDYPEQVKQVACIYMCG